MNNIIGILLIIIGIVLFCVNYYIYKQTNQIKFHKKEEIKQQQNKLLDIQSEIKVLNANKDNAKHILTQYEQNIQQSKNHLAFLHQQQEQLKNQLDEKEHNIKKYYKSIEQQAQSAFSAYEQNLDQSYQQIDKKYNQQIQKINAQRDSVQQKLNQLHKIVEAASAAQVRSEEDQNKWRFYSIQLSENQINDISKLQQWKKQLHDPSIVSKVIWSTYIIKPTGDLCNRVFGTAKKSGIYKITNRIDNKIYIGQSVNIIDRVKQHIKCGLGIDAPATNKLYKAMQNSYIWNWTFELLEECSKEKLNEREKFWIEWYQSDKIGYNVQRGNK